MTKIVICSHFDVFPVRHADQDAVYSVVKGIDVKDRIILQTQYKDPKENIEVLGERLSLYRYPKFFSVIIFNFLLLLRIHRIRRKEKSVVVITTKFHLTPTLLLASRLMGVRWISIFLDSFIAYDKFPYEVNPYSVPLPILRLLERLTYSFADYIYLNSVYEIESVKQRIDSRFSNKILRTPLSSGMINCTERSCDSGRRQAQKSSLNLPQKSMLVCFHGNFAENRQSRDAAFYIINSLSREFNSSDVYFLIIGNGLNIPRNPSGNVLYLGYVENLCAALACCDLEVAPIAGGSGIKMKILDALSVGIPVLASDDAARGLVEPSPVVVSDFNNFPVALKALLSDEGKLRKLGQESMEYAEMYYSASSSIKDVIGSLLSGTSVHRI